MRKALWSPGRSQPLQKGKEEEVFDIPHGSSDIPPGEAQRTSLLHAPKGTTAEQLPELLLFKAARAGPNSTSEAASAALTLRMG